SDSHALHSFPTRRSSDLKDWEQNLLEVALEKVKERVDTDAFQMFYLHIVKGWPATKVASTVGAKLPAVYFAKYKVSRLVKRELRSEEHTSELQSRSDLVC